MRILALESSCDETAAAVVENGRTILSSVVATQIETHKLYGGVVPEIASRMHTEAILPVTEQALKEAALTMDEIDAVAVTYAPGLVGPLLVGVNFAKALALREQKPLIPVHHLRGHIAANYLTYADLEPPFLCLVVSGGNTQIVRVKTYTEFELLGETRDDAAGEAFDKAGRVLGLPYPGGAKLDQLAKGGDPNAYTLPIPDIPGYDFSFSGLKTAVINLAHHAEQVDEPLNAKGLAASFCHTVARLLTEKFFRAAEEFGDRTLAVAGGVSANSVLRAALIDGARKLGRRMVLPQLSLCGDNAAMIGSQAYYEYLAGTRGDLRLNAVPYLPLTETDYVG